jgi:hypothetical protein
MGEGWHNNHHQKDIAASQAILPEEERSDITYQILLLLEKMDLIKIVYKYTDSDIAEARRLSRAMTRRSAPSPGRNADSRSASLRRQKPHLS